MSRHAPIVTHVAEQRHQFRQRAAKVAARPLEDLPARRLPAPDASCRDRIRCDQLSNSLAGTPARICRQSSEPMLPPAPVTRTTLSARSRASSAELGGLDRGRAGPRGQARGNPRQNPARMRGPPCRAGVRMCTGKERNPSMISMTALPRGGGQGEEDVRNSKSLDRVHYVVGREHRDSIDVATDLGGVVIDKRKQFKFGRRWRPPQQSERRRPRLHRSGDGGIGHDGTRGSARNGPRSVKY